MKKIATKVKALIPAVAILAAPCFSFGKAPSSVEKVQLWEDGPYWATCNIGAEKPEESGLYFWWGDTVGYRYDEDEETWVASDGSNGDFEFDEDNTPTYGLEIGELKREGWIVKKNGAYVLTPEHDAAHVHWGGKWRMPTIEEIKTLCEECDWKWTKHNGVSGYVIRGRGEFKENKIFVPAAGDGYGSSLGGAGSYGIYWSSVPVGANSEFARFLYFNSDLHVSGWSFRYLGLPVRPVQGFAK